MSFFGLVRKKNDSPAPAPSTPERPAPFLVRRRVPASMSGVCLAKITVDRTTPKANVSWLDLSLETGILIPPIDYSALSSFTVIDVETTGLDPYTHEIIEVSALRFKDFQPAELYSLLLRPEKEQHIPTSASSVNRITMDQLDGCPCFRLISRSFQNFLDPAEIIIGHNLEFDVKYLFYNGITFDKSKTYLDTLAHSKRLHKVYRKDLHVPASHRLEDLCAFYGLDITGFHSSAADCLATGLIFRKMLDEIK